MNDGDNHEDETASVHLVFLPLDTLTLPFQIYVHLTPIMMLQVFPPSMPLDKGIYPSDSCASGSTNIAIYTYT